MADGQGRLQDAGRRKSRFACPSAKTGSKVLGGGSVVDQGCVCVTQICVSDLQKLISTKLGRGWARARRTKGFVLTSRTIPRPPLQYSQGKPARLHARSTVH